MSVLQWALLLLGAGIAVMLVVSSRREKKALERMAAPPAAPASRDWGMEREAMTKPLATGGAASAPRAPRTGAAGCGLAGHAGDGAQPGQSPERGAV